MIRLGYILCGSFCTFEKSIALMKRLVNKYEIVPIMSQTAYSTDTKFGKASEIVAEVENLTGKKVISTIVGSEPLGPKKMLDAVLVAPCTGNTVGKIANGITDTSATMAVKSCLRVGIPVLLCVCTNDALSGSFVNIAKLMNSKNIYLAPMVQDDPVNKPNSLVTNFEKVEESLLLALKGIQMQPVF